MNLKETKQYMENKIKDASLDSYAVLVYKNGEKSVIKSDNVDEFTYFDMASTGKVLVTSTLVLQALSRGLLSLDATLDSFFDDVPEEKKNITVKQLLTHTSGIVRHQLTEEAAKKGREGIAKEILSFPLAYEPGNNSIYSCNGYILLGYILEKIYGMELEKVYDINIAKPLGIKRTAFVIGMDEPNSAVCYRWKRTKQSKQRFDDENILVLGKAAGSGGQQSCLHDVEKFADAIISKNEALYSEELFEKAEKNYTPCFNDGRGLGYLVVNERYTQTGNLFPVGSFGHCGHSGQSFFINREKDMYVIILTNATRFANMKNDFKGYDYGDIMKMREEIHNSVLTDLE